MTNSLIQPEQNFAIWAILLSAATIGFWSEQKMWGASISGAVVTMVVTFFLSNLGIIPSDAPAYNVVWSFLVPFSIPLLLFQANILQIIRESGRVLIAYFLGALGTVLGTIIAYYLVPIGELGWKLAGVFSATYIGGSVNFFATAQIIELNLDSGDLLAAGTAADNLVMTLFFLLLFTLPSLKWVKEIFPDNNLAQDTSFLEQSNKSFPELGTQELSVIDMSQALAISGILGALGVSIASLLGISQAAILFTTILIVSLATIFPQYLGKLTVADQIGTLLMQIFFAVIGASANIWKVIEFGPVLFIFAGVILTIHLLFLLLAGKLLNLELPELVVASNANLGGPTTAAAMAKAKNWYKLVTPAILCGILGYALATFFGVSLANFLR
ncbi:MAG: DUF819 family protein [Okeania sp. SIO3I5]|uniref:DUF819 family protein n=1 Tax=Okeania sp. SIO3I5 TaxID=2607805 RepID=UPI0013BCB0FA|nr:DUF819 family protein [Okeania sp. SIO3I5]NEQ41061.1 DUF819 family protein [Okeania sp. SIO3I5]